MSEAQSPSSSEAIVFKIVPRTRNHSRKLGTTLKWFVGSVPVSKWSRDSK